MIDDNDYDFLFKILLVGDTGVGKTHLLSRYIKDALPIVSHQTIGVEFARHILSLKSGVKIKAHLWDTSGQERYRVIVNPHYRRAVGALLVYDVTNQGSFESVKRWMKELRERAEPDIVILLVGNKIDSGERKITKDQGVRFAKDNGLLFVETSAITFIRIKEAFEGLLEAIYYEKSRIKLRQNIWKCFLLIQEKTNAMKIYVSQIAMRRCVMVKL